jgi:hypothetical protein
MRTTLTLDDDVAIRLGKLQAERSDSFKAVVNAALRAGLDALSAPAEEATSYRITPHPAGGCALRDLDSLHEALAFGEGEAFR